MKQIKKLQFLLFVVAIMSLQSCRLWDKIFPAKYGCPQGKNTGAEQVFQKENAKALKAAKKGSKSKN